MGHFAGFFEGVKKVVAPSINPKKCPIICFAPDKKKTISRTFKIRGALVFLCPKEGEETREKKDQRQETRDERRETRDERREMRDKRRVSERIKVLVIIFLNCPGQNEKSAKY